MSRFRPRRPTPGLIVATIALVVASTGVGYAAGSPDSKSDAKTANKAAKTYFNAHIAAASVAHAATAGSATTAGTATTATTATSAANAGALGGSPPSAFELSSNILTAAVTNDGVTATVVKGTPGVTANRSAMGVVVVTFPRDITSCVYLVSTDGVSSFFSVARKRPFHTDQVEVFSFASGAAPTAQDTPFDLAAIC
jgi:hypothetical protein